MKAETLIDAIMAKLYSGKSIEQILTDYETDRGFSVIRPGDVEWLPLADWLPMTIVSSNGTIVRLVAISAQTPGTGAFRRLCEALRAIGLVPHVVSPMREMQEKLRRWKWRRHVRGEGLERQEWWTPRNGACPKDR
jgi:hypothetical protein